MRQFPKVSKEVISPDSTEVYIQRFGDSENNYCAT